MKLEQERAEGGRRNSGREDVVITEWFLLHRGASA